MRPLIDLEKLHKKDVGFWVLLFSLVFFLMALTWYSVATGKSIKEVSDIKDLLKDVILVLVAFRWGSSRGSQQKTELLNKTNNTTP